MAQYKVPQNVEAEDKILGPLSLRQFIYVIIAIMWAFLMWRIFLAVPLIAVVSALPVSGVFLALGLIQREEQSFENYFVAMIRFIIVPRQRMWHKDDVRSALKTPTNVATPVAMPQRDPSEIRGQLEKLALVVDTRGRVPKPASIQLPDNTNQASALSARVNRPAAAISTAVAEPTDGKITANDDILDMQASSQAATVGKMLADAETEAHERARAAMQAAVAQARTTATAPAPTPTSTPAAPASSPPPVARPVPAPDPTNISTVRPIMDAAQSSGQEQNQGQNDILDLAMSGSSLSVAQIGAQAKRTAGHLIENQPASLR